MFEFAWPWIFVLLPIPALSYYLLPQAKIPQQAALRTPFYRQWSQISHDSNYRSNSSLLRKLCLFLVWLSLLTAIARPQFVGDPIELPASGRDLLLSIDISGSMEEQDLELNDRRATRLAVVKNILADFITRREGDRLGLILFGEKAYLQTPLTFDHKTIQQMLQETEIGLAGASRTAIGDGIGLAIKRLKERDENNRVLILLTDGQNNTGELEPIEAAKLAQHAGVTIYTIGVGADELIISGLLGTRKINPSKELDEETLRQVAQLTGGKYFRARNTQELDNIYQLLDELEPIEDKAEVFRPVKALFYYPLTLAFLLSVIMAVTAIGPQLWHRTNSINKVSH